MSSAPRRAYVTLLTTDSYGKGVLALQRSLVAVESEYPLVVMVTPSVGAEVRASLAADGCELDLPRILSTCKEGLEVPDLRKRYIGALQAKRLDAALLDAAAACASRDETLALERQLHVSQRGVLMEPPYEFDEDGNIIIERRDRYY